MRLIQPSKRPQQGFSLLEAIVALTIMATCLLALYAWLSTNTLSMNRVRTNALALQDARAALAMMESVNPMATPEGRRELAPLEIRWKASPVSNRRVGRSAAGSPTQFDFRLYQVDVDVLRQKQVVYSFSLRKAGWEVTRPILMDDL